MSNKIMEMIKHGNIVIPKLLLSSYKKLKIEDNELILIIYFINNEEFDPEEISKILQLDLSEVLKIVNSLSKKDILKIKKRTINNITEEYIDLNELYNKLLIEFMNDKEEKKVTIYDEFEKEFARTLSPVEYEIIGAWLERKYEEETIKLALKEAIYNGVTNLKYIDKILSEWNKKGIKTKFDVEKDRKQFQNKNKGEIFDYDWLNDKD